MTRANRRVTFLEVLSNREFAGLWIAWALSVLGDQFARVALSLLVFDRTGSPALTAATYAISFIPDLVGGPFLAGLADRFPRRQVMIVTDVARGLLVAVMAISGLPIAVLLVLLFAVQLLAAPFTAARIAMTETITEDSRFTVGSALMDTTYQVALVAGFPLGAVVVTLVGTSGALVADAATFLASAVLLRMCVRDRPPTTSSDGKRNSAWSAIRGGLKLLRGSPKHQALLALACLAGFYVAPEGLVVPYADQLGVGPIAVGLLLAANPVGTAIGMVVLARVVPNDATRARWLGALAIVTCAMLLPMVLVPGIAISLVLWTLVGFFSAHDTTTKVEYVKATPDDQKGQLIGLAVAAMRGAQGIGVLLAGVLAQFLDPARVIALMAVIGVAVAVVAARAWRRASAIPPPPGPLSSDH
ncbi:MAG: MFS transporter [Actinophytocola sp.]|uniref:MFS transporter n=1 Tax=Actinophytocola sp. TaxID=1872138 RepID=UPI003C71AD15